MMKEVGDADREEMCAAGEKGNTCGAGPLNVQVYTTSVTLSFCTKHQVISTSHAKPGIYPSNHPLVGDNRHTLINH